MSEFKLSLLPPDLQVAFSQSLLDARKKFLQESVLETIGQCDLQALQQEAIAYVEDEALRKVAAKGMRTEVVFALPSLLQKNPMLLGYYRLVLGFSKKMFYGKGTGMASFQRAEDGKGFTEDQKQFLPELCMTLNKAAAMLVQGIEKENLSAGFIADLSLLTFGPQLRGSRNVALGSAAIQQVFEVVRAIIGERASKIEGRLIVFTDSTGRMVEVRFNSDPDIEVVSIQQPSQKEVPLLAIEVKGGTDISNAHNRLGEAEKSHLKAKKTHGYNDLWTIVNVAGLSEDARKQGSPTTTAFFDLSDIVAQEGEAYNDFRERFLQKLRLPETL